MDLELNDSLISVIIPVYNIESYLDRCVDSVLKQTFQNTEVLLVDDGSTDRSGLLCDEWAGKDPRVRVIHKPNGGLSDARNAGIAAAGGAYLAFVDGDDYLDPDMIRKLYAALKSNDADLSICNFLYVDEAGAPIPEKNNYLPIGDEVLSGSEILRRISQPDRKSWYYVPAWNKLYKRALFQDLRFAYGKIHEDEFLIHHLLGKCEKAACIRDAGYCYVQRAGSIMGKRTGKSNLHAAEAYLDRARFCRDSGLPECAGYAYWKAAMFLADAYL
ncbi:MAG: glycosyltransferase, partial [Bacteroidales bacterium]|nr:glycosyltransferase [Bacteroidales bacterium]